MKRLLIPLLIAGAATSAASPLTWKPPEGFDPSKPGLGLPSFTGAEHSILYSPEPFEPQPAEGGKSAYESLRHGTYNHHQQFLQFGNKVIVYWTNHLQDENGPGQRLLAKVGTLADDGKTVNWGGDDTLMELAPAAMTPKRRQANNDTEAIDSAFLDGELAVIDGKIYLRGRLQACHGWTDDMRFHNTPLRQPVPEEHYRNGLDKSQGFRWDLYWFLGSFVQQWDVVDGRLTATSPVYFIGEKIESLQLTPSLKKQIAALQPPYRDADSLDLASEEIRNAIAKANRGRSPWQGHPRYAEGMFKKAANGKDGLAHWTEFQRPDGQWVVLRDNLLDPDVYYAAVRPSLAETYSPAIRTNLFGTAMPVAGSLPDGSIWIVGGNRERSDMYLTLSRDGITFDRSWSLLHERAKVTEGVSKTGYGGPQYFKAIQLPCGICIVYSLGKERIGITTIPFTSLTSAPQQ